MAKQKQGKKGGRQILRPHLLQIPWAKKSRVMILKEESNKIIVDSSND